MKQHPHVPLRSCVICGTKTAKRELVRVVLMPDGECVVEETGKRPGRGGYLGHRPDCWDRATSGSRLAHALRGDVSESAKQQLAAAGAALARGAPS